MSRFAKARALLDRHAESYPYRAVACASVATRSAEKFGHCISAITDRGTRCFAFRRESARNQFIASVPTAERAGETHVHVR